MLARLLSITSLCLLTIANPFARRDTSSQCDTGNIQCCNATQTVGFIALNFLRKSCLKPNTRSMITIRMWRKMEWYPLTLTSSVMSVLTAPQFPLSALALARAVLRNHSAAAIINMYVYTLCPPFQTFQSYLCSTGSSASAVRPSTSMSEFWRW